MSKTVPHHWKLVGGNKLRRVFVLADFASAWAFMTHVALLAQKQGHHPDWSNNGNKVTITLFTADAGAVTAKDHKLAQAINDIILE